MISPCPFVSLVPRRPTCRLGGVKPESSRSVLVVKSESKTSPLVASGGAAWKRGQTSSSGRQFERPAVSEVAQAVERPAVNRQVPGSSPGLAVADATEPLAAEPFFKET